MPDDFEDALDRLDISIDDFDDVGMMLRRLAEVLGVPPTLLQANTAMEILKPLVDTARAQGLTVDRFQRAGAAVIQLRDARGRFVTSGAANISARIRAGAG